MTHLHKALATALLLGAAFATPSASASQPWSTTIRSNTTVHEHSFDRLLVKGDGCTVSVKVSFDAPAKAYQASVPARNSYLFRARVKLKGGQEVASEVFRSGSPSRRGFTFTQDTTADGCWAKEKNAPIDLKVVGCRGKRCRVPDFE